MPRFCIHGCGKELVTRDGGTDYGRMFFSATCRNADKAERMRSKRAKQRKIEAAQPARKHKEDA